MTTSFENLEIIKLHQICCINISLLKTMFILKRLVKKPLIKFLYTFLNLYLKQRISKNKKVKNR